jgi:hypothetical protein
VAILAILLKINNYIYYGAHDFLQCPDWRGCMHPCLSAPSAMGDLLNVVIFKVLIVWPVFRFAKYPDEHKRSGAGFSAGPSAFKKFGAGFSAGPSAFKKFGAGFSDGEGWGRDRDPRTLEF